MISFPNSKINLGLHILNKRADGFHNLETIFYPVNIKDALEIVENKESGAPGLSWSASGKSIEGKEDDNLCIKAFHLVKKDHPQLPDIKMHLHKNIPSGAGLGGGSADAAFTLQLLNKKFSLSVSAEKMQQYALHLGSDCPFFLVNRPAMATGRGEILKPVEVELSLYKLLIVNPGIHVNTGWAFEQLQLSDQKRESLAHIIQLPVNEWKYKLVNDFEAPVFAAHPAIKKIKETLYSHGAIYAAMSGSGSSVFGIFEKETAGIEFPAAYFCKWV
ncbi:MAG: 4-(cytidine 5'-diphospho)-2-C-methyl-D-erythritol kinase [Ferruginibacter sp.]